MKKIAVVYWSGTGNTQKMAVAVAEGAKTEGNEVSLWEVGQAPKEAVLQADAVAFGCPSMGCEVLEEGEMEPFIQSLEAENLSGKVMALFGSYDWGDGEWMRDWEARMKNCGVTLVDAGLIIQNTPDEAGLTKCTELGKKLA
jgi:flavodoxin short chain